MSNLLIQPSPCLDVGVLSNGISLSGSISNLAL